MNDDELGIARERFEIGDLKGTSFMIKAPYHCSVFLTSARVPFGLGVISVDNLVVDGRWWVARLLIRREHRNRGLGGYLVDRLLREMKTIPGVNVLECAPGGYDSDPDRLVAFYQRHGFRPSAKPGLLVWYPGNTTEGYG